MEEMAILCSIVLVALSAIQEIPAIIYASQRGSTSPEDDGPDGKVVVCMPLRGADPFLPLAIKHVLAQDYPNFELHIIIDRRDDPAWNVVEKTLAELNADNVVVSELVNKKETCGLICSSWCQCIDNLDDSVEFITICPADMVAPPNWLRLMSSAMQDAAVGATLGNRWYMPRQGGWGSLVRYLYNVGAIVPMWVHQVPWGGTMLLRVSDFERTGLRELWGRAMCEDVPVYNAVRAAGLNLRFVPELLIVNREEISLTGAYRFFGRQNLLLRMYHPRWWLTLNHFAPLALAMFLVLVFLFDAVISENSRALVWCAGSLGCSVVTLFAGLVLLEKRIRSILRSNGEEVTTLSPTGFLRLILALPLTLVVTHLASVSSIFARKIQWRGITYDIRGPFDVTMREYTPFEQPVESDENRSI